MSRAAAAQSIHTPLYLIISKNPQGDIVNFTLRSAPADIPNKRISSVALTQQHINMILFSADADLPGARGQIPAILRRRIASFATPLFDDPNKPGETTSSKIKSCDFNIEKALHLQGDHLRRIALALTHALHDKRPAHTGTFFRENIDIPEDVLSAALNADFDIVKIMLEKNPNYVKYVGTATIDHLGIERTGTLLQMALYSHDEEMVAYFKEKMEPTEFERQSKEAFATALSSEKCAKLEKQNASVLNYHQAMLKAQLEDAKNLCAGLKDVFSAAAANQFSCDGICAASTSSTTIPNAVDAFIKRLADYVARNPVHNPYILQNLYEIYERLPSNCDRDCFFSQKVIGGAHSFLSPRWLQHYAQGIYYLTEENEAAQRAFICRDSNPGVDVRQLVSSCIGDDSLLSLFGRSGLYASLRWPAMRAVVAVGASLSKLMSSKNNRLSELITRRVPSTRCCIIQ